MASQVKYVGNDKIITAIFDAYNECKVELKKERDS
jgi:hypothetical protein